MKSIKKIARLFPCLITCLFMLAGNCMNGQVVKRTVEEMTHDAESILYGKCTRVDSKWDDKHERIYTEVTVSAEEYLKGNQGGDITITVPGGRVGNYLYEVTDMPAFSEGEEFVAFLSKHSSGRNLVTGTVQGKLKIHRDPYTGVRILERPVEDDISTKKAAVIFDESTQKMESVTLEDFVAEIKGYLGQ